MKTQRHEDKTIIAVPYYGTLSLPPSGLVRVFFLVKVDLVESAIASLSLQVWNPKKEPNLFRWLRQMETDGVICSDSPSKYEAGLNAEGMWVQWGQEGEVYEVVDRWLRTRSDRPLDSTLKSSKISRVTAALAPAWELS